MKSRKGGVTVLTNALNADFPQACLKHEKKPPWWKELGSMRRRVSRKKFCSS